MKMPKTPGAITALLKSSDPDEQQLGHTAFLRRTHWPAGSSTDDLKIFACNQLRVKPHHVLATYKPRIEPAFLWASQDGLESEKLKMVETAYHFLKLRGEELPPIVVWSFYDSQKMRYVIHDGHHRTYFSRRFNIKIKAVILEPLGNYSQMEEKFRYAFQIRKRAIDLPVTRQRSLLSSPTTEKTPTVEKEAIVSKKKPVENNEKAFPIEWEHIDAEFYNADHLKDFNVVDVKNMFERVQHPMVPELAYLAFLIRGTWGIDFNIQRGVDHILMDLHLPLFEGQGLSWRETILNPKKIWASQDSLDYDIIEMVRAGFKYMLAHNKPLPPVSVWKTTSTGSIHNYVAHDGHHRIFVANEMGIRVNAIMLEYWIDNREESLLAQKIPFQRINTYAIDLPIIKFSSDI